MPEPFSSRKVNLDGSRNIFCSRCHEFICVIASMEAFNSALCKVCQLADQGIVLPQEELDKMRSTKIGTQWIPNYLAFPPIPEDPMGDDLTIKTGRIEYFFKVLSTKAKELVAEVRSQSQTSTALAKEKRKSRVFDRPID